MAARSYPQLRAVFEEYKYVSLVPLVFNHIEHYDYTVQHYIFTGL